MPTPVVMPRLGETVETCLLVTWHVEPGQYVEKGSILATIETDKTEFDVEAPVTGTVLELLASEGEDVPVLTNIATIGDPDDTVVSPPDSDAVPKGIQADQELSSRPITAPEQLPTALAGAGNPTDRPEASPRAQRAAMEAGIDISGVVGTGPQGRITERDVEDAITHRRSRPTAQQPVREEPVRGARKIIAQRMRDSLATTAQLSLMASFDATAILDFRTGLRRDPDKERRQIPTITDLVVFETARVLLEHPEMNAHYLGDSIAHMGHVNMGVAVDTPKGLLVPVLLQADTLDLYALSAAVADLSRQAREGTINPDLLKGGTFTVTNMGTLGIEVFTPILNPPEVAILGVGAPVLRPKEQNDAIHHYQSIGLSLTIDHQAVDGAPAARFLQDLVLRLERHPSGPEG